MRNIAVEGKIPYHDNGLCLLGAFCEQGIRLSSSHALCHLIQTKF